MPNDVVVELRPDTSGNPVSPKAADNQSRGEFPWTTPENVRDNDNNLAIFAPHVSGNVSDYLNPDTFNFVTKIPNTANILGVEFTVLKSGDNTINDSGVFITKDNSRVDIDKSISGPWPVEESGALYGGSTDIWGTTWTPSDFNNNKVGLLFSAVNAGPSGNTGYVDHIDMTVYYGFTSQHGSANVYASPTGHIQRLAPSLNTPPDLDVLASGLTDRFDDPRYYSGDTPD